MRGLAYRLVGGAGGIALAMRSQWIVSIAAWAFMTLIASSLSPRFGCVQNPRRVSQTSLCSLSAPLDTACSRSLFLVTHPNRVRAVCLVVFGSAVTFELGQALLPESSRQSFRRIGKSNRRRCRHISGPRSVAAFTWRERAISLELINDIWGTTGGSPASLAN